MSPSGSHGNESRDGGRDERRSSGGHQGRSDRPRQDGARPPYRANSDRPQQGGERAPYRGNSDRPAQSRDGERPPYRGNADRSAQSRDGERKPWAKDGERPAYRGNSDRPQRDGERPPYRGNADRPQQGGDRPAYRGNSDRPAQSRDGERKPWAKDGERGPQRNSDRPAYRPDASRGERPQRDGERKPWAKDGERPAYRGNSDRPQRGGERPAYRGNSDRPQRGGDRPAYRGNSDRPAQSRDGERKPWSKDGASSERPRRDSAPRDGERKEWGARGGSPTRAGAPRDAGKKLWTREGAPARGDRDARAVEEEMTEEQRMQRELRAVRPRHDDPELPDDVTSQDLDRIARNELKTLTKDNAEAVGRHLAMAARVIDEDPQLAHRHVLSAARRAGRIAVVRESLAITAYATGDFALALRELRTYRRISGSNDQLPLMVDSERGVGRPDRALELGRSVDRSTLPASVQVALAIAMSGARLDLGEAEAALSELEIPQLDPKKAFSYSPELFSAYAEVLEELGRDEEAETWHERAARADAALGTAGDQPDETMEIIEIDEDEDEDEGYAEIGEVSTGSTTAGSTTDDSTDDGSTTDADEAAKD